MCNSRSLSTQTQRELLRHHERALLQTVFARHGLCQPGAKPVSVGPRGAALASFAAFVAASLAKLKLPPLSAGEVGHLEAEGARRRRELSVWWAIKGCLARPLESLILWDRVLHLRRAGMCVRLEPLFDALLSPRQYVIVAWRAPQTESV